MPNFNVGIISESIIQQQHLRQITKSCGLTVFDAWLVAQVFDNFFLLEKGNKHVDFWLIDIDSARMPLTDKLNIFERWLYGLSVPVIFGEGRVYNVAEPGFTSWSRLLSDKLLSVSSQLSVVEHRLKPAKHVWVLAASTGGPKAVKAFLDTLPTGLELALVYVQHIEAEHSLVLVNSITRNSDYQGHVAGHGDVLCVDTVTLISSDKHLDILADGTLALRNYLWRGIYKPSIDHMVATVADRFGPCGGAIYFSGMGDDGMVGARLMSRRGGNVWIQVPSQCTADSMPNAINNTGCVTVIDSAKNLAIHLQRLQKEKIRIAANIEA